MDTNFLDTLFVVIMIFAGAVACIGETEPMNEEIQPALGYMDKWNWWIDDFERRFRLDQVDYRVHFALNCGPQVALGLQYLITNEWMNS